MRFEELSERRQRREITMVEAAEILGVPTGHFAAGVPAMKPTGWRDCRIGGWAAPPDESEHNLP